MKDDQPKPEKTPQRLWLDLLAVGLSFLGLTVSFWGAAIIYLTEAQIPDNPVWPLPGLVLVDWALLGFVGYVTTYISFRRQSGKWLQVAWFTAGGLIPLIILGAFSIGPLVLISFLLFIIATIILTVRHVAKWLGNIGLLMIGSIVNLGAIWLIIALSGQPFP